MRAPARSRTHDEPGRQKTRHCSCTQSCVASSLRLSGGWERQSSGRYVRATCSCGKSAPRTRKTGWSAGRTVRGCCSWPLRGLDVLRLLDGRSPLGKEQGARRKLQTDGVTAFAATFRSLPAPVPQAFSVYYECAGRRLDPHLLSLGHAARSWLVKQTFSVVHLCGASSSRWHLGPSSPSIPRLH